MGDSQESVKAVNERPLPLWLRSGLRKVVILGPALFIAELAGVVALFTGHMPPELFRLYTIGVLTWGGGIFAGANVLEHIAKGVFGKKE